MPLKIFHTADVHLGLTFSKHPEPIAKLLTDARAETLERMVSLANQERCDLFVVGGDLFDTTRVPKKMVIQAAKILSGFEGLCLVLPGNHDYITYQPDEIWSHFQEAKGERVRVVGSPEPLSLVPFGVSACVYPAPCGGRYSKTPAMNWITKSERDPEARFHIGLAHGSYEGLTPDLEGEYFPMSREELLRCRLDLWLMGHIHLQFPVRVGPADQVFFPGTPEPDGFDCRHEGKAWLLEIADDKRIQARSISTGAYRFLHEELKIQSLEDIEAFKTKCPEGSFEKTLLKLKVTGSLPRELHEKVTERIRELESRFLRLIPDYSSLSVLLTSEEMRKEFPEGSLALRLIEELSRSPEDHGALRTAYELIQQVKGGSVDA